MTRVEIEIGSDTVARARAIIESEDAHPWDTLADLVDPEPVFVLPDGTVVDADMNMLPPSVMGDSE